MHRIATKLRATTIVVLLASALALAPSAARAQFGVSSFTTTASSSQAGAHPDLSASFALDTNAVGDPIGQIKNATVTLPPGLVGNPRAVERCSTRTFEQVNCQPSAQIGVLDVSFIICQGISTPLEASAEAGATEITVADTSGMCGAEGNNTLTVGSGPSAEQVKIAAVLGATKLLLDEPIAHAHPAGEPVTHVAIPEPVPLPLFNLQPTPGHVATFGSWLLASILLQVNVDADGRVTVTLQGVPTLITVGAVTLTLWGVPADPSHDALRCNQFVTDCGLADTTPAVPFMTNPSDCTGSPPESQLSAESWQGQTVSSTATLPTPTGCGQLELSPSLTVAPDTDQRDTPAGYEVDLKVPQEDEPYGLATPDLRDLSVALPAGTSLSPAMTNGLLACSDAQFAEGSQDGCPNAAKVGSAEVTSPLLDERLTGAVYIGSPTPSEKFRVFVRVSAGATTIDLKGHVVTNEGTGQVTAVFDDVPQLPLSDFRLVFFGGPQAVFANPASCGPATSDSQITSYGGQTASPSSTFTVGPDSEETACPASLPFAPSFSAGTTSPLAGGFSPFTLTVSRADGQQQLSTISAQLPAGLLANLAQVPLCAEAQAATGSCSALSQIGTTTIGAGAGAQPLYISGGVYLTGPYDGAPFGLSIVVPATAGPFELGTIVVRSRIVVNPQTMQMTIASDPFPRIVDGIPLRLRAVNLTIDRGGFIFNPTSCASQTLATTVDSVEGAGAELSTPFTTAGCTGLPFTPRLGASTQAKASSQGDGAGLDVKIATPAGTQSHIRSVSVRLPTQLRPRLTTIQQACPASAFSASPASCPPGSRVGVASVSTPVLSTPLHGTIFLVARGGTSYPEFKTILESQGIAVELDGAISVSSSGILSTAFRGLPDVPMSSFEVQLSRGPSSILGAVEGLCAKKLEMPYKIAAQNGVEIERTARIAVAGCPKARTKKATHKAKPKPRKRA